MSAAIMPQPGVSGSVSSMRERFIALHRLTELELPCYCFGLGSHGVLSKSGPPGIRARNDGR